MVLDHREMALPVGAARQNTLRRLRNVLRRRGANAPQDHAGRCGEPGAEREFTEILVERHEHSIFHLRASKDLGIFGAGIILPDPCHVMAGVTELDDRDSREVLVRQETHGSGGERVNPLRAEDLGRVAKARRDVLALEARVVLEDLGLRPALRQEVDDELDRQAGTPHDRLTAKHLGIEDDSLGPIHATTIIARSGPLAT